MFSFYARQMKFRISLDLEDCQNTMLKRRFYQKKSFLNEEFEENIIAPFLHHRTLLTKILVSPLECSIASVSD